MNEYTVTYLEPYTLHEDYTREPKDVSVFYDDIGSLYETYRRHIKIQRLVIIEVPPIHLSSSLMTTAARISCIAKDLISLLAWPDSVDMSPTLRTWRALSIESVRVGCNIFMQETLTDGKLGLDKSQMKLISGMTKQASKCLTDFYKSPESFSNRKLEELHKPLRVLIERLLRKKFPDESELLLQFDGLCQAFFDGFVTDIITPSLITKILLNLEFPYGAKEDEEEEKSELFKLCHDYEQECNELGDALIDCVDIMINTAKDRLIDNSKGLFKVKHVITKAGVNIGTGFLRKFKKYIGGYIFATVNAALRSDGSKVLQIVELWIQRAGTPRQEVDELTLRQELDETIRKDMTRLVKYVINEKEKENIAIKEQAVKVIEEIAPLLVELVWDTKSRPIAHLLCHYLPEAPIQQFFPTTPDESLVIVNRTSMAQKCENLIIQFVQDYLLSQIPGKPLDQKQKNWEAIFMCSIKIGIRKAFAAKEAAEAAYTIQDQIVQLGMVLAAVNAFLTNSISKKHTFDMSSEEIEKPLVDFLKSLVQTKYPGRSDMQEEVVRLLFGLINKTIDTIFDPFFISNMIIKIKLDKSLLKGLDNSGKNLEGYDAIGLEAVRLMRTILSMGNQDDTLGWIDKIVGSIARRHKEIIGSKIAVAIHLAAQSNATTMIDMLEKVLWSKGEDNKFKPIFFDGWIEDKVQLQAALMKWLESELLPFVSEAISSQGLWGSSMIESKLRSIVRTVAEKLFKLLWHDKNKAIRILLLRYLLPIAKSYLPIRL